MPATTWTPTALASEARPWRGSAWRAVEAQHQVATMRLTRGRLRDQALLEDILDSVKPPQAPGTERLHWLLATPFRYPPPPHGSRFRRPFEPGVFYAAEDRRTACAEAGYWRWRFWRDSAGLRERSAIVTLTLFQCHAATDRALDLTLPPLAAKHDAWTDKRDYSATQALAEQARAANLHCLRYESARRPAGYCVAFLNPRVFRGVRRPFRDRQQNWSLLIVPPNRTVWQRPLAREQWAFDWED